MQRKELVNTFRSQGKIKGGKPCVIYLKNNIGKIYNEGYGDFILSQKNNDLYNMDEKYYKLMLDNEVNSKMNN